MFSYCTEIKCEPGSLSRPCTDHHSGICALQSEQQNTHESDTDSPSGWRVFRLEPASANHADWRSKARGHLRKVPVGEVRTMTFKGRTRRDSFRALSKF